MRKSFTIIFLIFIVFASASCANAATNAEIRQQAKILYMGNQFEAVKQSLSAIPKEERTAEDYYMMAIATENTKVATKFYYSALKLDPNFYQAYYNIASSYLDTKNYSRAIDYLKMALNVNKKSEYVYYNLGCAYLGLQEYNLARKNFEAAIKINPYEPDYYYNLAYTHKMLKNDKRAQKAIDLYNQLVQKRNES